ncbi:PH domain-containing protein [Clostridium hydrogeniformans]|uniref:PH domain-containing protein n=1 Tax=Clostridium hydrogeniformans TaxID=349933 RepID=UPI0004853DF4|nr:PH domain-containing protein [Clostridium hydrogeniformans]
MGIFSGLVGNASESNMEKIHEKYSKLLGPSETIERAYSIIRDLMIFTNKRLIIVDIQGITGKKVSYHSVPYKSITHFQVETAGHFDLDAELKIWISSTAEPVGLQFNKSSSIYEIQGILAEYISR